MNRDFWHAARFTLLLTAPGAAYAGDLNPPAGPVAPTMKTMSQVEPRTAISAASTPGDGDSMFRIASPGTYYLTADVYVGPGKRGIEIAADDVTIDLCGFRIGGFSGTLEGIAVVSDIPRENITVRNGLLRNLQHTGILLAGQHEVRGCRVEDVTIADCGGDGVRVDSRSRVARVIATNNVGNGVHVSGHGCIVERCVASENAAGFSVGHYATVSDCSAYMNTAAGISAHSGASMTRCAAAENGEDGIRVANGCTITDCSAVANSAFGFRMTDGNALKNCTADSNGGNGFSLGSTCNLTGCTARQNADAGVRAIDANTIVGCTVSHNIGGGIRVESGNTIAECTAVTNGGDGIRAVSRCAIRANNCVSNALTAAGLHVTGSGNRIEDNNCAFNGRGLDVDAGGNYLTHNGCSGNVPLNWDVGAGNVCTVVLASASPAISGDLGGAGGQPSGTNYVNANFTY